MGLLELPHSAGCLVCGRTNPKGLRLSLHVDEQTGAVEAAFTPGRELAGFDDIVHGGALAAVLDEALVWAATWHGKHFVYTAEMTVRYRRPVELSQPTVVRAWVETARPRLTITSAHILDTQGQVLADATGKHMPLAPQRHAAMLATFLPEESTFPSLSRLRGD